MTKREKREYKNFTKAVGARVLEIASRNITCPFLLEIATGVSAMKIFLFLRRYGYKPVITPEFISDETISDSKRRHAEVTQ